MNNSINYGIKTGCNDAFIIDNETREALLAEDPKSEEILKPILRGRDIKRYRAEWAELWLIATLPALELDIDDYQAVKRHLLSFGKHRLQQTGAPGSRKATGYKWYETQDSIAYHAEFMRDKIVYPETMREAKGMPDEFPRFFMDFGNELVTDKTAFIITGQHLPYLCTMLNSKIVRFLIPLYVYSRDSKGYLMQKLFAENITIPRIPQNEQQPFVELLQKISVAKARRENTNKLEEQVDNLAYTLFSLTKAEIAIIEERR